MIQAHLRYPIILSIAASIVTLALKTTAYLVTGSVGLLSDAAESIVNLVAAVMAYLALRYAAQPVDREHPYGHEKIEFFSSGLEGGLILVAAVTIAWYAVRRLIHPELPEQLGLGLSISLFAAVINGAVAMVLLRAGRKYHSIVLEADGKHLLTDVWTSAAVLAGLGLVMLTKLEWLDPIIALLVAANILWTAAGLMWRSFHGLMDHALPEMELTTLRAVVAANLGPEATFHALRTRQAGAHRFVEFHLLVPGKTTVRDAHDLAHRIEDAIHMALPYTEVTIHVEPIEDRASWEDSELLALEKGPAFPAATEEQAPTP
jgi:cation diffusion facilitator family transporter